MLQQTSIMAFEDSVDRRLTQYNHIFKLLSVTPTPLTNRELERLTGFSISSVTARVNALVKRGLVCSVGVRRCTVTGFCVHEWVSIRNSGWLL